MKTNLFIILCFLSSSIITQACPPSSPETKNSKVQIALLLDTSGSMSGLIEQAKAQLWNIANDITNYKKNKQDTYFEIALYEYGKDEIAESEGYIRQLVTFTSDMDHLSEVLFSLRTNGGSEYCGLVIHKSLNELKWNEQSDMKMIYIAGNESFAQGSFPYQKACQEAKSKAVIINTIFCGNQTQGINLEWNTGAVLGLGDYHNIDHNQVAVHFKSPYDAEINRLNSLLNDTYIFFGKKGQGMLENMKRQDVNANLYGAANSAKRSIFKSKSQYDNSTWDLVDAYKQDKSIIKSAGKLPSQYKGMSPKELELLVEEKLAERKSIQQEIACSAIERDLYIVELKKKHNAAGLGDTILHSLSKQMKEKGFVKASS